VCCFFWILFLYWTWLCDALKWTYEPISLLNWICDANLVVASWSIGFCKMQLRLHFCSVLIVGFFAKLNFALCYCFVPVFCCLLCDKGDDVDVVVPTLAESIEDGILAKFLKSIWLYANQHYILLTITN
jgi:hypothetical protein